MRLIQITLLIALLSWSIEFTHGNESVSDQNLRASENLIDVFYSFDKTLLLKSLKHAQDSIPSVGFYQGWAEGGNYKVMKREACKVIKQQTVSCSITVQDDLMLALGIDFNVTDTFTMTFNDQDIVKVDTSSNDLDVFWQARDWVKANHAALITKPCEDIWNGGPTPGDCVRAMVKGYGMYAKSETFPDKYKKAAQ